MTILDEFNSMSQDEWVAFHNQLSSSLTKGKNMNESVVNTIYVDGSEAAKQPFPGAVDIDGNTIVLTPEEVEKLTKGEAIVVETDVHQETAEQAEQPGF